MYNLRFENLVMFNKRLHKSCCHTLPNEDTDIPLISPAINWVQ